MFFLIAIFIFLFFAITIIFSFPKFSPIPYYPTNHQDLPLIIKALKLKNNQTIIDLGAGDGVVIFKSAKFAYIDKLNTQFIAVDINPVLIFIMHLRRLLHPNRKNIKIIWADMFNYKFKVQSSKFKIKDRKSKFPKQLTINTYQLTIYLYISPWLLEKIVSKIKKRFKDFHLVSYFYPVKSLKKKEKTLKGKNNIYYY